MQQSAYMGGNYNGNQPYNAYMQRAPIYGGKQPTKLLNDSLKSIDSNNEILLRNARQCAATFGFSWKS